MTTTILTAAAFIALVPAGLILFLVIDRYAAPKVPVSVFEEFKVLVALIIGIPAGLPITLAFEFYANSLQASTPDLFGALAYLLLFVALANLGRMILLRFRTFSGDDRKSKKAPFYVMAFGCGTAVTVLLAEGNTYLALSADPLTVGLLSMLSIDLVLLESWAGLRFTAAHIKGRGFLPVMVVEIAALFAIAPLYLNMEFIAIGTLLIAMVVLVHLLHQEDIRTLRPLIAPARTADTGKPFGRTES
jgi:hypothetical protein